MKRTFLLLAALALAGCDRDQSTAPVTEPEVSPTLDRRGGDDDHDNGDGARGGVVYTLSNATAGNAVLAFARRPDGSLAPSGSRCCIQYLTAVAAYGIGDVARPHSAHAEDTR